MDCPNEEDGWESVEEKMTEKYCTSGPIIRGEKGCPSYNYGRCRSSKKCAAARVMSFRYYRKLFKKLQQEVSE